MAVSLIEGKMGYLLERSLFFTCLLLLVLPNISRGLLIEQESSAINIIKNSQELGYGNDLEFLQRARNKKNPIIDKALYYRDIVAKNNFQDVTLLLQLIKKIPFNCQKNHVQKAIYAIEEDEKIIHLLYNNILNSSANSFYLRHGIKVLATRKAFQKAKKLIECFGNDYMKGIISYTPFYDQVTYLKLALFYLAMANETPQNRNIYLSQVKMFYPIQINSSLKKTKFKDLLLFDELTGYLWLPHAGYVLGAFSDYGFDCSSLVSKVCGHNSHISTADFESIWNYLSKKKASIKSRLLNEVSNYIAIHNIDDIDTGDIVIWRWPYPNFSKGHAVIFIEWEDKLKKEFLGIEAAQIMTTDLDGVGIRKLNFERNNTKTCILRRKNFK